MHLVLDVKKIYTYIYHISPKVYDFINCWQNKNFKYILFDFDVFIGKLGLIFKLGQLIGYLIRNISMEKLYRKHAIKTSAISRFDSPSKNMEDIFYFI